MADIINLESKLAGFNGDPAHTPVYTVPTVGMEVLESVINATWNQALSTKSEYSEKISTATDGFLDATNTPTIMAGEVDIPVITEPSIEIPTTQTGDEWKTYFDSKYLELANWLTVRFEEFGATYFPDEGTAYVAAEAELNAMLANPGSYLSASVQAQIFGSDQARIIADKARAQDAVVAQFASRRFPLPPDAAASAVLQIEQKAQNELAESSRKIAFMSVEQFRFVIEKTLGLRQLAMGSAVEYIKALASGPEMASKLVTVGYDAQSKLISSAADFYRARIQASEAVSKVQQYNNSAQLDASAKNQSAEMQMIEDKLKALLAEAQSIAQMSTALFNNLHAQVGLSTNGQTVFSATP